MANLSGKTVLVLGGTSGMGLATARAAAERGAKVVAAGRSEEGLVRASNESGANIQFEIADATDTSAVSQLLERIDGVDHVFVTAGRTMNDPKLNGDPVSQAETFGSRFWSAVNVARAAGAHVRPGGSVTFTSGVAAWKPIAGEGFAAASCAAVEALTRQLALDMKPIRFNAVTPGFIDTPLLRNFVGEGKDETYAYFASVIPVGRIGAAEDVAHAVIFLMENEYVTGTALVIDGGFRLT